MLKLDLFTTGAVGLALLILVTLILLIYRFTGKTYKGFDFLIVGAIFFSGGSLLLGLRNQISDFYSIILANLLLFLAANSIFEGTKRFYIPGVKKRSKHTLVGLFFLIICYFIFYMLYIYMEDARYRTIWFNLYIGLILITTATIPLRYTKNNRLKVENYNNILYSAVLFLVGSLSFFRIGKLIFSQPMANPANEEFLLRFAILFGSLLSVLLAFLYLQITRSRIERELRQAIRDTEKASQVKSEFLSYMSHELRTPLNAVMGFSQLLEMDPKCNTNNDTMVYIEHIKNSGHHLLNLINDILDLSRIEAGKVDLTLTSVNIKDTIEKCFQLLHTSIDDKLIHIDNGLVPKSCLYVTADPNRLQQILLNVIGNAIKYNQMKGKISIHYEQKGNDLEIAVVDSGIGMNEEQLYYLFQPFNRLGQEKSNIQGTGIGLTISKKLVVAMNGSITAESKPQQGSTFKITLPLAKP